MESERPRKRISRQWYCQTLPNPITPKQAPLAASAQDPDNRKIISFSETHRGGWQTTVQQILPHPHEPSSSAIRGTKCGVPAKMGNALKLFIRRPQNSELQGPHVGLPAKILKASYPLLTPVIQPVLQNLPQQSSGSGKGPPVS